MARPAHEWGWQFAHMAMAGDTLGEFLSSTPASDAFNFDIPPIDLAHSMGVDPLWVTGAAHSVPRTLLGYDRSTDVDTPDNQVDETPDTGGIFADVKPTKDNPGKAVGREKVKPTDGDTTTDTGGTTGDTTTDTGGATTDTGGTTGDTTTDTGTVETNPGSSDPGYYVAGMDNPDGFNIELDISGTWVAEAKATIISVAEYLCDVITADIPSFNGIDDIVIQVSQVNIDGSGGALAQGGWIQLRTDDTKLPVMSAVQVDAVDVDYMLSSGKFEDAIFHEMLHALGFGTTWYKTGLTETIGGELRFVGDNAIEAYNSGDFADLALLDEFSLLGVPVTSDGFHWDQGTFGTDVMSPSLGSNEFVSDMTVAALEDMGYQTIYGDAMAIA
ncbi:hypothetical protein [Tropicimonas sp. IMCC6043]|uniref:hypothetical protein n=1 Tax=Tropicimonas sp. IMCC6043 TaxID=2510645 RepID=UPI00101C3202|nr:hypothetical protein [Tropicimonas sp. IMCC6043]RYH12149.1 hypothetical protein EU800_00880 [Tropicimonas sp. IMCC6043]